MHLTAKEEQGAKNAKGNSDASLRSTTKKSKRGALHHSKSLSGIAEDTDRPAAFNITLGPIESTIFELGAAATRHDPWRVIGRTHKSADRATTFK